MMDALDGIAERITEYLSVGGLVNPEQMEHEKVRELLLDCRTASAATKAEYEAKLAAAEARLSYIEQLRRERSIWIELRHIDPKSIAFETEGSERWLIGGQGVGDTGRGKTLREAIDAARTPSPVTP